MDNREIDKLVAEKVFNWEWREREYNRRVFGDNPPTYHVWWDKTIDNVPPLCLTEKTNYNTDYTPPFSTDISAAWQVVEKINSIKMDTEEGYQIRAKFILSQDVKHFLTFSAQQAALIICLAALKAVGVEIK